MILKPESDEGSHSRTKIHRMVLDLASAARRTWPAVLYGQAGGLAAQSVDILFKRKTLPAHGTLGAHRPAPVRKRDAPCMFGSRFRDLDRIAR
jgi:hypothetical protein